MPHKPVVLTIAQARKIVLLSQGIHHSGQFGRGTSATYKAIEMLGYVQIDSISVVERAHHHSLFNRVSNYQGDHLSQLVQDKQVFEYWAHAAAYLPMKDYRFSLPRKQAFACGDERWYAKDANASDQVMRRIKEQGPLQAKDFLDKTNKNSGWWDWKPAKKALELLFMEGELMVVKRQGFQKVYDLTERVLPAHIDTSTPSPAEYADYLIIRYLKANGIAKAQHIGYLLKGQQSAIRHHCQQMVNQQRLITVQVDNQDYFALPSVTDLLHNKLSRSKVKILSPFDNLLIQRARTKELFDYNYQIECYVPANKRQYGYFSLPLLWGQGFAGRMDVKMDRKNGVMQLLHLHIETPKVDEFLQALKPALSSFQAFNKATSLVLNKVSSIRPSHKQADLTRLAQGLVTQ
jgi:uncharacterized protein YcaQ